MGNAALIRNDDRFALAQRTINLAPYADFSGAYLELLLLTPWFTAELARRATGITATGIKAAADRFLAALTWRVTARGVAVTERAG